VRGRSARRFATSNDWMNTGAAGVVQPRRASAASNDSSSGRPIERKYDGCFVSGYTPMRRPVSRDRRSTRSRISSKVGIGSRPSCACERKGSRSLARSVLSSASVKSSLNQPVVGRPPIVRVVFRSGNLTATSVVPPISCS
jgi:hypothetical protein